MIEQQRHLYSLRPWQIGNRTNPVNRKLAILSVVLMAFLSVSVLVAAAQSSTRAVPDAASGAGMDAPPGYDQPYLAAAIKTWDGSTSSDWHVAANWTPIGVPTITDDVVIPNVANDPIISSGDAQVNNLTIESDAVLDLTDCTLTVEGILTNTGTLKQTSVVSAGSPASFLHVTNLAGDQVKYYGVEITPSAASGLASNAAAFAPKPQAAPLSPDTFDPPSPRTGYTPPKADLSHLSRRELPAGYASSVLPPQFDWRDKDGGNYVTSVKNQSTCGACYSFASIGSLESKLLIDSAGEWDLSENNAKECNWHETNNVGGGTSCLAGNFYKLVTLFAEKGTVLETCDPYQPTDVSCNSSCAYQQTLLDWRVVSGMEVPEAIMLKQYLYDHGPLFTVLYAGHDDAWGTEFDNYTGTYTLYYTGTEKPNHAVLLVGWDDSLTHPGGTGGWIVKNSWGEAWGDGGYFKIAYGSASIGADASFVAAWKNYDSHDQLLYNDEGGWLGYSWGFGNTTGWGLAKFVPISDAVVTRVEFWTTDVTTDVDVYLYDSFDGTSPGALLASKQDLAFSEAGYHSVPLPPLPVAAGDDVIAVIKFTNATYNYPIPLDDDGLLGPYRGYVSHNGSSWSMASRDVGIRVRINTNIPVLTPTVTSIAPNMGANTGPVRITDLAGSNFMSGASVKLTRLGHPDISAANVNVVTATQITCDMDLTGAATGLWNVVVTNLGGVSGTLTNGFTITESIIIPAPVVTSITPNTGVNTGTLHITDLAGANFQTGATVQLTRTGQTTINATSVVVVSPTKITGDLNLNGAAPGAWNVLVTNPDGQSGALPGGFTVTPGHAEGMSVTVSVSGGQFCAGRTAGVKRCFDVSPLLPLNAALRFYFGEAERNDQDLNSLVVLHYGGVWEKEPGPYTRGSIGATHYVQVQNVNDFSLFALGRGSNLVYLPLILKQ